MGIEREEAEAARLEQVKLEEKAAAERAAQKKEEEEKKKEEDKKVLVEWLKKNGFKNEDVNTKKKGSLIKAAVTPLCKAVTLGNAEIVRILVESGADHKEMLKGNKSLLDKAKESNNKKGSHEKVIAYLEQNFTSESESNTQVTEESKPPTELGDDAKAEATAVQTPILQE